MCAMESLNQSTTKQGGRVTGAVTHTKGGESMRVCPKCGSWHSDATDCLQVMTHRRHMSRDREKTAQKCTSRCHWCGGEGRYHRTAPSV